MATYSITGMTCGNCVAKVQEALGAYRGAGVTLNPPRVTIPEEVDPGIDVLNEKLKPLEKYTLSPVTAATSVRAKIELKTYYPLFLILGFISIVSLRGSDGLDDWMLHFMAGFFIVFSFFKLLNLKGFADAYAEYDMLAARWYPYGLIYPFLELGLGLCYLFRINLAETLCFTIILMTYSSVGVIRAVLSQRKIRCACLGTSLNLPMSTITIIEDLGMVAMAVVMLLML